MEGSVHGWGIDEGGAGHKAGETVLSLRASCGSHCAHELLIARAPGLYMTARREGCLYGAIYLGQAGLTGLTYISRASNLH